MGWFRGVGAPMKVSAINGSVKMGSIWQKGVNISDAKSQFPMKKKQLNFFIFFFAFF